MSGVFEVRDVGFEVVAPWRNLARRERVTMENPDGCQWIAAFKGAFLAGFAALVVKSGGSARFKSDWVRPEFRRQGVHALLLFRRENICKVLGSKEATAFCTPASAPNYLDAGFQQVAPPNAHGIVFLRKRYAP